jgi:hypothetical protein
VIQVCSFPDFRIAAGLACFLDALDPGVGRAGAEEGESIERQIEESGKVV